ncbi:MAG TPA: flagellar hook-length control protein FliK [Devosiaceae bacterium]
MPSPVNIAIQPAPSAQGTTSGQPASPATPFDRLLAALLAAAGQEGGAPAAPGAVPACESRAAGKTAAATASVSATNAETTSPQSALHKLMADVAKALDKLASELEHGGEPRKSTIENAIAAVTALAQFARAPETGKAPDATQLVASVDGAKLIEKLDGLREILAAATANGASAPTAPPPQSRDAGTNTDPVAPAAVVAARSDAPGPLSARLSAGIADVLKTLGGSEPEFSARLETVMRQLQPATANAPSQSAAAGARPDSGAALSPPSGAGAPVASPEAGASPPPWAAKAAPTPGAQTASRKTTPSDAAKVTATPQADTTGAQATSSRTDAPASGTASQPAGPSALPPAQHISPPTAQATPPAAAYQRADAMLNVPQVAFEMARQVQNGQSRFQIRLDPPELGRIDVKMRVDSAGNVHAHLTVDHPGTFDMLQRDARGLERALANAGVDDSRTTLEFSLRQDQADSGTQQGAWQGQENNRRPAPTKGTTAIAPGPSPEPGIQTLVYRGIARPGGLDRWA